MIKKSSFRFTGFREREERIVKLAVEAGRPAAAAKRLLASSRQYLRTVSDDPQELRAKYDRLLTELARTLEERAA